MEAAKGWGGAWTQPMHLLYTPSLFQSPHVQVPPKPPKDPCRPPTWRQKTWGDLSTTKIYFICEFLLSTWPQWVSHDQLSTWH
jgi:hypothetical protein